MGIKTKRNGGYKMSKLEKIIESIENGQYKQAKEQARHYGMKRTLLELCDYDDTKALSYIKKILEQK